MAAAATLRRGLGGNVPGHVFPGTAFLALAFGVWLLCRRRERVPLMLYGVLLVLFPFAGVITEAVDKHGSHSDDAVEHLRLGKEHASMYSAFLCAGLIAVLETREKVLPGSWRLGLAAALGVEGFLFYGHATMQTMMEHNPVEGLLHGYLAYMCFAGSACFAGSVFDSRRWVEWAAAGATFIMMQTVWFYFLAWSLYSGAYGSMAVEMDMGAAMVYVSFVFLFSGFVGLLIYNKFLSSAEHAYSPIVDGLFANMRGGKEDLERAEP